MRERERKSGRMEEVCECTTFSSNFFSPTTPDFHGPPDALQGDNYNALVRKMANVRTCVSHSEGVGEVPVPALNLIIYQLIIYQLHGQCSYFFPFCSHTHTSFLPPAHTRTGLPRRIQGAARGSLCATRIAWCAEHTNGEGGRRRRRRTGKGGEKKKGRAM